MVKLRGFIISPYDRHYRAWETYLVALVMYNAWASPFEFGFLKKPLQPFSLIDNVVNGFFGIDIILTLFFLAYFDKSTNRLVDDRKKIAWRYASTWLAFDVISTIPSECIWEIFSGTFQSYGLSSMLRLWRLHRVSSLFVRLEKNRNFNYFWVRLAKLIAVALFAVHSAGCFYYYLAAQYPYPGKTWIGYDSEHFEEESLWIRYVRSIYWSMTTVSTVGYGDLSAQNPREMIFVICYMFFNFGITSYLIGNITNLVVNGTSKTAQFREIIQAASSFAQRHQLPTHLHDQILGHLCMKFRTDSEVLQQQESLLDSLPEAIRSSISHFLFYPLLEKAYLFHGVSKDLLSQLVSEMKAEYISPKEDVILQNQAPTDFYVIVTGAVELVVTRNGVEHTVGEAKTGDLCGEIGVLCYRPQLFTVRTKRLTQLLRLNRTTFLKIIEANVGDGTAIINNLLQHLKDINDPLMERVLIETENMIAHGRLDLPLSLCFATLRGDDLLLEKLLKRGLDANEPDNNGRTALHIAASKGNTNCVLLLLDFGADPNSRDSEGNVPMWEAILGGHEPVVKILKDSGADLLSGDVGKFSCTAAEENNLDVLKQIVKYGGDVTLPNSSGSTALHVAVCEGNIEIVKYLLKKGADIDKPDDYDWTPRDLAEQQGHHDIIDLFLSVKATDDYSQLTKRSSLMPFRRAESRHVQFLGRLKSDPSLIRPVTQDESESSSQPRQRQRANNFQDFNIDLVSPKTPMWKESPRRVIVGCSGKSEAERRLVLLPQTFEDLLQVGVKKFGFLPSRVLIKGVQIDDIEVIRDGDHLVFEHH